MLSQERQFRITSMVNLKSFVTVGELVEELNASRSTINRDLIELEKKGLIKRERGGAVKIATAPTLSTYNEIRVIDKEKINAGKKKLVCQAAAANIQEDECIFIDSGSTPIYLLDYLGEKKIKLVTVSTYLLRNLPLDFRGEIYLLGGAYQPALMMNAGWLTLEMIDKFNFDRAFFSTSGINAETGELYSADFMISSIKQKAMTRSKVNYMLMDSSKFDVHAFCTWANAKSFTAVYTDAFPKYAKKPDNFIICQ